MYSSQRVGCTFAHLLCLVCKPLCPLPCHGYWPALMPYPWHRGHPSAGLSMSCCLLWGAFLFLLEGLESPCSGVLHSYVVDIRRSPGKRCLLGSTCTRDQLHCAPPASPRFSGWSYSFLAPIPVQGRLREWLFPLPSHNWHSVYWDAVWPAVSGKTYSWLLALKVTCVSTEAFWDFHLL